MPLKAKQFFLVAAIILFIIILLPQSAHCIDPNAEITSLKVRVKTSDIPTAGTNERVSIDFNIDGNRTPINLGKGAIYDDFESGLNTEYDIVQTLISKYGNKYGTNGKLHVRDLRNIVMSTANGKDDWIMSGLEIELNEEVVFQKDNMEVVFKEGNILNTYGPKWIAAGAFSDKWSSDDKGSNISIRSTEIENGKDVKCSIIGPRTWSGTIKWDKQFFPNLPGKFPNGLYQLICHGVRNNMYSVEEFTIKDNIDTLIHVTDKDIVTDDDDISFIENIHNELINSGNGEACNNPYTSNYGYLSVDPETCPEETKEKQIEIRIPMVSDIMDSVTTEIKKANEQIKKQLKENKLQRMQEAYDKHQQEKRKQEEAKRRLEEEEAERARELEEKRKQEEIERMKTCAAHDHTEGALYFEYVDMPGSGCPKYYWPADGQRAYRDPAPATPYPGCCYTYSAAPGQDCSIFNKTHNGSEYEFVEVNKGQCPSTHPIFSTVEKQCCAKVTPVDEPKPKQTPKKKATPKQKSPQKTAPKKKEQSNEPEGRAGSSPRTFIIGGDQYQNLDLDKGCPYLNITISLSESASNGQINKGFISGWMKDDYYSDKKTSIKCNIKWIEINRSYEHRINLIEDEKCLEGNGSKRQIGHILIKNSLYSFGFNDEPGHSCNYFFW